MKQELLTNREEEIMQIVWKLGPCTMSQIMDFILKKKQLESKPAPTTVSTFLRILVDKKYLNYKAYGKTYEYYPIVSKIEYAAIQLKGMIKNYFGNSPEALVSFLVEEEELEAAEIKKLLSDIKKNSKS